MAQKKRPFTDDSIPPPDRAAASLIRLKGKSEELTTATDTLGAQLRKVEKILSPLNLVSAWCTIASGHHEDSGYWWSRELGYSAHGNQRFILLKTKSGGDDPQEDEEQVWRFSDAPHWMQVDAVSRIPDLLEELGDRVEETTEKIKKKTDEVANFAAALAATMAQEHQK